LTSHVNSMEGNDMTLFRLDASIRTDGSASREITDIVEMEWLDSHPGDTVVRRHIGVDVLPADAWGLSVSAAFSAQATWTDQQRAARELATASPMRWPRPTRSCSPCRCTTSACRSTSRRGST
jgi:hypothetical protein